MASKNRKRVFPKKPKPLYNGVFDKGTVEDLGKNSHKAGYYASLKAIYHQLAPKKANPLNDRQSQQLEKLRENLSRRNNETIKAAN